MNKSLISLALLGVLVFGLGVVYAATLDVPQDTNVTVLEDLHMIIGPNPLGFGSLTPSGQSQVGPDVTFNTTGSNVDLTVTAAVSNADALFDNIDLKTATDPIDTWTPINSLVSWPFTKETFTIFPSRITIPVGTVPGIHLGQIVYTVMGPQV